MHQSSTADEWWFAWNRVTDASSGSIKGSHRSCAAFHWGGWLSSRDRCLRRQGKRFGQVQAGRCGAWTGGEVAGHLPVVPGRRGAVQARPVDQAHRLPAQAQATPDDRYLFLTVAELEIGRDEFQAADARRELIKEQCLSPGSTQEAARVYAALSTGLAVHHGTVISTTSGVRPRVVAGVASRRRDLGLARSG